MHEVPLPVVVGCAVAVLYPNNPAEGSESYTFYHAKDTTKQRTLGLRLEETTS